MAEDLYPAQSRSACFSPLGPFPFNLPESERPAMIHTELTGRPRGCHTRRHDGGEGRHGMANGEGYGKPRSHDGRQRRILSEGWAAASILPRPNEPIVIELNINIRQEVIYRLAEDAANTIDENAVFFDGLRLL